MLLIDLDPQGNATASRSRRNRRKKSLRGPHRTRGYQTENCSNTFRLSVDDSADLDLAGAEIEVARLDDHLTRLRDVLADLIQESGYDYLFLTARHSL